MPDHAPAGDHIVPRFEVFVTARVLSADDAREHSRLHGFEATDEIIDASLECLGRVREAVEEDTRVSDAETHRGPEGTILSEFILSAADVDEAQAIGHEVFRCALLKAGERADWTILVGAKLPMTDDELARSQVIVVLRPDLAVGLTWPTRQVLMRRLESFHGTGREHLVLAAESALPPTVTVREMFEAVRPSVEVPPRIALTPTHQTALLLALEEWSCDPEADEAMPRDLLELQDALRALQGRELAADQ